jgi:four helix bundle protein
LTVAKGSTGEVKSQLYRALDQNYISRGVFDEMYETADIISEQIDALRVYLNRTEIKGRRYQKPTDFNPKP